MKSRIDLVEIPVSPPVADHEPLILIHQSEKYCEIAAKRLSQEALPLEHLDTSTEES